MAEQKHWNAAGCGTEKPAQTRGVPLDRFFFIFFFFFSVDWLAEPSSLVFFLLRSAVQGYSRRFGAGGGAPARRLRWRDRRGRRQLTGSLGARQFVRWFVWLSLCVGAATCYCSCAKRRARVPHLSAASATPGGYTHTHTHTHTQAKTKATERWNRWIRLKKMPPHSELANAALVVGGLPVAASASASRFRKAAHKRRYKRSRSNSKSSQPSDEELSSSGKQQNIWVKNTFEELLGNTSDPANLKDSEKREFNWITSWIIWYLISGSNNLEGYRVVQVEPVDLFLLISLLVYANICNRYVRSNDKEMMLWIWYVPSLQLLGLFAVALVGSLWIRGSTIAYWLCSGAGWPSSSSERGKLGERVRSEIESSNKSQQGTDLQRQKKKKTTDPPWWSVESEKFFCWQVIQPKR